MKLIKISTELELTVHEFPTGGYREQAWFLCKLIGNNCEIYERVNPRRLYTQLYMKNNVERRDGQSVCMLVDEEGALKDNEQNLIGSYLYETDRHGAVIWGDILFVGEKWCEDGIDFCGIGDCVFQTLKEKLDSLIFEARKERRR